MIIVATNRGRSPDNRNYPIPLGLFNISDRITMSGFEILGVAAFVVAIPGIVDSCIGLYNTIKNSAEDSRSQSVVDATKDIIADQYLSRDLQTASLVVKDRKGVVPLSDAVRGELGKALAKLKNRLEEAEKLLTICIQKTMGGSSLSWSRKRDLAAKSGRVLKQAKFLRQILNSIVRYEALIPKPQDELSLGPTDLAVPDDQVENLPHSEIFLAEGNAKGRGGSKGYFILESMDYNRNNPHRQSEISQQICDLAQPLLQESPGILKLLGFRHSNSGDFLQLVFEMPSDCSITPPRSLHDLLLERNPNNPTHRAPTPSLTSRWDICYQLAAAVLETHNRRLVHKNICPQNLLLHPPKKDNDQGRGTKLAHSVHLGTLFLTHWVGSRIMEDATTYAGPGSWERGIYQHPDRQLKKNAVGYGIGHDMYSLGVCMLEILLWQPFVEETDDGTELSALYRERAVTLDPNKEDHIDNSDRLTKNPKDVQAVLVDIAMRDLPAFAGDKVSDLVVNCLTCLENGFDGQYNVKGPGQDEPIRHVETGLNYILDVLKVLST